MTNSISNQAIRLYPKAIVVDNAIGIDPEIEVTQSIKWAAIEQFFKAGVTYAFLSVATDLTSLERAVQYIALCRERIRDSRYFRAELLTCFSIELIKKSRIFD